jgi:S-adenosyl methyltransferase
MQDFTLGEHWDDPFDIDTSVAHPARRYNYWLGGKDNFEADRISGDAGEAAFPTIKTAALENRRFLRRAVTYLVKEAGIRQFLDFGTGIPSADNVHEVAQSIAPEARVVYVDNDPIVLAHARRLLASAPAGATAYIHADLRDSDAIFDHPDLRKTLDLSQPVALMLIAVLHFFLDADDPYSCVSRLVAGLPSGSYFAASHGTTDFMTDAQRETIYATMKVESARSRDPSQLRDKAAFARFFDGMELVPPGVVSITAWHSDTPPGERPTAADVMFYGGVARVP